MTSGSATCAQAGLGGDGSMESVKKIAIGSQAMAFVFDTVPANRGLIDMNNPREVNWWTKRFACNEVQLREAVEQVGPNAAQVEQLLDGQEYILTV
jgi:hypothetical protein